MSSGDSTQSETGRPANGHPPQEPPPSPNRQGPQEGHDTGIPKDLPRPKTITVVLVAIVFFGLLAGLFVLGWIPHHRAAEQASADAADQANSVPTVSVVRPRSEVASKDIVLPCDVRPNQQAALRARTTGYLKRWTTDIGGHVKQGDLLAVIDAPDVDAQLNQTRATLEQAKANVIKSQADVEVALTDYQRYLTARTQNPGSVTEEDVDAKRGTYSDSLGALKVAQATVEQNAASVQQLVVLQGFDRITAPFSGTITARNYDVGALITAGSTAAGTELFDIADTDTLRVFVNVPQNYSTNVTIGQPAFLTVRNYAGREFQGTVTRMSGALDPVTRTLPFELDFPNPSGELYAGMYGQARLPISRPRPALLINSSALIFNADGLRVAVVRDHKISFQKITVGRDLGTDLEIVDGLTSDDQVVSNPGERLAEGVTVQTTSLDKPAAVAEKPGNNSRAGAN